MTEQVAAPEGIEQDAAWFAENGARYWQVLYRLRAYVTDNGPVRLPDGRVVGMYADGYQFDTEAVADEFPALVESVEATIKGSDADIARAISLIAEEVPAVTPIAIRHQLDKDAVNGTLRGGGSAGERLKELRTQKSKLGTR